MTRFHRLRKRNSWHPRWALGKASDIGLLLQTHVMRCPLVQVGNFGYRRLASSHYYMSIEVFVYVALSALLGEPIHLCKQIMIFCTGASVTNFELAQLWWKKLFLFLVFMTCSLDALKSNVGHELEDGSNSACQTQPMIRVHFGRLLSGPLGMRYEDNKLSSFVTAPFAWIHYTIPLFSKNSCTCVYLLLE